MVINISCQITLLIHNRNKNAMNLKQLVRLSNITGIIAIVLLIYWVFIFIIVEVFGLRVFRENLSETFYMSILGIMALLSGALMLNIMSNLTRIAEKHNIDKENSSNAKKLMWAFLALFPILALLLFGGDYLTSKEKEKMLVKSAQSIVEINSKKGQHLVQYSFDKKWITETQNILDVLSKIDENFSQVSVIVRDTLDMEPVFLSFNRNELYHREDSLSHVMNYYIRKTSQQEREYLHAVFDDQERSYRYSSHDGNYELFYPYQSNTNEVLLLYFSQYQRFGKIGS